MRQIVEVRRLLEDGRAEVLLNRKSACAGNCESCGGCAAEGERILAEAENRIGARPGDRVVLESDSKLVIAAACIVYLLPILLFFAGYAVGAALAFHPELCGGAAALLGLLPMLLYNRWVLNRKNVFRIVELCGRERD